MRIETGEGQSEPGVAYYTSAVHLGLTLVLIFCSGCGSSSDTKSRPASVVLKVAAASDLQGVLPVLAERFTGATGIKITPVVGASGQLAQQIRQGAPYDVFLSANLAYVRELADAGKIEPTSVRVYATGRLALVVHKASRVAVDRLPDLARNAVKRIAIANPEFAPYGLAARQALEKASLWESLKPKIVQAESVRQAMQFVQSGNAEAGLVAHSVASDPEVQMIDVDPGLYEPILQGLGVVSESRQNQASWRFTEFLRGDDARKVLTTFGFGIAPDDVRK